ncbi:MAG: hypothetical protein IPO87_16925 [Flavobacteriales bacterium]|nr:hypothetical protein [Flavobacteriales bacterium]
MEVYIDWAVNGASTGYNWNANTGIPMVLWRFSYCQAMGTSNTAIPGHQRMDGTQLVGTMRN